VNCTICNKPIVLVPSAAERAARDTSHNPASYYTNLFTEHSECTLRQRAEGVSKLMASHKDK
jgi:hypothetical protein